MRGGRRAGCCRFGCWGCKARESGRRWWIPFLRREREEEKKEELGPVVNDAYFGKLPAERLG